MAVLGNQPVLKIIMVHWARYRKISDAIKKLEKVKEYHRSEAVRLQVLADIQRLF